MDTTARQGPVNSRLVQLVTIALRVLKNLSNVQEVNTLLRVNQHVKFVRLVFIAYQEQHTQLNAQLVTTVHKGVAHIRLVKRDTFVWRDHQLN